MIKHLKNHGLGWLSVLTLAALLAAPLATHFAPGLHAAEKAETLFTCGMHPQVIQDHPGNCPICGMKLTPMRKGSDNNEAASGAIRIDPVTTQNMGLRTSVATNGPLRRTIRTTGIVDFDETRLSEVSLKFKGWIERLHASATGQEVKQGESLFEIYSPELYSAQAEYLVLLGHQASAGAATNSLLANQREKLALLDIPDAQIATLEQERKPRRTLSVLAPRDGIVLEKMVVEGQMIEMGMRLFRIADLSQVWVICQVFEKDLPLVKVGQEASVTLPYSGGEARAGKVAFIYPTIDEKTRAAKVRVELDNPELAIKPGMYASVDLHADLSPSTLLIPDMAVLRSGESNTVFVALEGGKFEVRQVKLGPRGEHNQYQVLEGVKEGEKIVTSGQFMLDSESQLREAIQKMSPLAGAAPATPKPMAMPDPAPKAAPAAKTGAAKPLPTLYTCPMASDVKVVSDKPGKCPECEMDLIETGKVAHGPEAEKIWHQAHP